MTTDPDERLAAAFGRFAALVQIRAEAGLAHPDRSGADRALRDLHAAASRLIEELFEDDRYGHCDTCGAPCDAYGCTVDRFHNAAIDPFSPGIGCGRPGCTYRAIDAADYAEHVRLNHTEERP